MGCMGVSVYLILLGVMTLKSYEGQYLYDECGAVIWTFWVWKGW